MTTDNKSKDEAMADTPLTEQVKPAVKPKKAATPKKASTGSKGPAAGKKDGARDIGVDVKSPTKTCTDKDCPFHGTLPVRGQILEGEVISDKMQMTAVVKRDFMRKNLKYERLEKRSGKYLVHNPPCLDIEIGNHVKIMECRPLSKQVSFVIIEKMGV